MVLGAFVGRAASLVATGLAGALALEGVKKAVGSDVVRGTAVGVTALGLRGARAAETGAEKARLVTADIVAEARERIGEQAPAPGAATGHGHAH
ncbi:DUF1490 family protein [Pseudonocardia sp.]|uniref:DUF1490 family protein n=1 Tax=Pseudonocardia sp. TaxID=60912 RepID=UPI002610C695|nr:DUF1490 family protein [Pseudonocardia sp.]